MSTTTPDLQEILPAQPKPTGIVCPHCGTDPTTISVTQLQIGAYVTAVSFCGNLECRKIFSVNVLAIEQPRIAPAMPKLRLS